MNKTAIKNFAVWARNKLIADITYKAGLLGITEKEVKSALPQSTKDVQFFDIGTKEPFSISGIEIEQRDKLAEIIKNKAKQSDYETAYKVVVEEVAYTWFNRLIAVRFMEVNEYLPSCIRVLSSESANKTEPDLVTTPFETDLDFTPYEKDRIVQLTHETKLDELFRMLFIKQCNALNTILPNLFEKTNDYTELLLNVSFTDKDGVVSHLVHDILEDDFNISKEGQVEIIGWLYQYYNTEPKDEAFALLKKNVKITKERIPAATQLFTPDWIVRYMVENSLGRLWLEGHPNEALKSEWKYYLDEAEQKADVQKQLDALRMEYKTIKPEEIKVIDPCMGSGHILVYAFDVLMQIYVSCGYSQREAAKSIIEHNIYGLDIDSRAYQLAYFAVMMKARQYNRRILNGETDCHVYSIQESNRINRSQLKYFGAGMDETERNLAIHQMQALLDTFKDAKEYGSILNVKKCNWELLYQFLETVDMTGQMTLDNIDLVNTKDQLRTLVEIGATMAHKYDVVVTNPPYMGGGNMNEAVVSYLKTNYPNSKLDFCTVFFEKAISFSTKVGFVSMIILPAWMFLSSYEKMRLSFLNSNQLINMLHFGRGVFGSDFGSVAFVIQHRKISNYRAHYEKLFGTQGSVDTVEEKEIMFFEGKQKYFQNQEAYYGIPGLPIAYWATPNLIKCFSEGQPLGHVSRPRIGQNTGDNDRFLRLWHEVNCESITYDLSHEEMQTRKYKWLPYNKGGSFRKWFGNQEYIINWENDGKEVKEFAVVRNKGKHWSRYIQNIENMCCPGVTWTFISSSKFGTRYLPSGFICDVNGSAVFPDEHDLIPMIALLNTSLTFELLRIENSTMSFQACNIAGIPFSSRIKNIKEITCITRECILISQKDWDEFETSWNFKKHPLFQCVGTIAEAYEKWQHLTETQFSQLKTNEEELNRIFIDIYGLLDELTPEVEEKDVTIRKADLGRDIRSFVSYAVGCMFGRYSLDVDGFAFAGGQWDDSKYSTFIPDKDNILPITDEEYFEDDIVGLFETFINKVYGDSTLEQNLDFIANALGNKGNSSREIIRNYFVKDFFKDHCKIYQKRPIYWLFDSGKADGFKALVYMHRYDENTIGNLRIDYLHRMQRVYDSEIARMQENIENSTNAREITAAEKRKEKLTKQLKETKEYDEKIAHLAVARISIDLDDGVKVNYEKVQTGTDGKKLEVLAEI